MDINDFLLESDFSNLALHIAKNFTTYRPLHEVIENIFRAVGRSLRLWTNAKYVAHVFTNPSLKQCHRIIISMPDPQSLKNGYEPISPLEIPAPTFTSQIYSYKKFVISPSDEPEVIRELSKVFSLKHHDNLVFSQLDFSNTIPLGHFILAWDTNSSPNENELLSVQQSLWQLGGSLARMCLNHYPIRSNTYLPSFFQEGLTPVAILFADIRNFTSLFEVARLGGKVHVEYVTLLLKAWLKYSSNLISNSGIGRIHKFTGDGIMATFGEYLVEDPKKASITACCLALHAGRHLIRGFQMIYESWKKHSKVDQFYYDNNEDVDSRLGIGINFGNTHFGYFGTGEDIDSKTGKWSVGGYLEYTAIGDHVNIAQRLESVASKRISDIDLLDRGGKPNDFLYTAPIIVSQTVSRRIEEILNTPKNISGRQFLQNRRGIVRLKGKGLAMPFFELWDEDLNSEFYLNYIPEGALRDAVSIHPPVDNYIHWLSKKLDYLEG